MRLALLPIITLLLFCCNSKAQEGFQLNNSHIAFTVAEKDLLPESIAYDEVKGDFYVGSTRKGKIIRVSKSGEKIDFVSSKQEGLWMIIGMEVDAKRRHLWVCSSGGDNLVGYELKDKEQGRPAGVFKFDLDSGKLIKKYTLEQSGEVHFFNDVVITKEGDVYLTHMFKTHAIYKISQSADQLELAYSDELIRYPNGLVLSEEESTLFVAHAYGIASIDFASGAIDSLKIPEGLKIARRESVDGLYFLNNSLIGIQPDINTVQQFILNEDRTAIIATRLLEVNHPMMNNPTTGKLIGNTLYYIANAQFGSFNKDGTLFPMDQLYEVCVLKLKIE